LLAALLAACAPEAPLDDIPTLDATLTWAVDFDAEAEAAGRVDCSYSRVYEGELDLSSPWQCPDCDQMFRAEVGMPEPERACFAQISEAPPGPLEWLGLDADGTWYRAPENYALEVQGVATPDDDGLAVSYETDWKPLYDGAGEYRLTVTGQALPGMGPGDPWHGYFPAETYTCGWIDRDAPPYTGPWTLTEGARLPDGTFHDRCDEAVRLHDFAGRWLIIDISAMDCGPCQNAAFEAEDFLASLDVPVTQITLLAPTLEYPIRTTTSAELDAWVDAFDIEQPVLADRGWGYRMGVDHFQERFGYPTIIVVGPDLIVREAWVGFTGWDLVADVIDRG